MKEIRRSLSITALLVVTLLATGCAGAHNPADPFEPFNRGMYRINDSVDKAVFKPVAEGYKYAMPLTGRIMVTNFFSNLNDFIVTGNDILQFKLAQGVSDGMRIIVNSTIGVFGLIDVASAGGLKKHNEDFGQTLGKWGFPSGPYLVLPILGPSSVRDGFGIYADLYIDPMFEIQDMRTRNQAYLVRYISRRADLLDQEKVLTEAMIDPYEFSRDTFLLYRKSLVYDGNLPRQRYDLDE